LMAGPSVFQSPAADIESSLKDSGFEWLSQETKDRAIIRRPMKEVKYEKNGTRYRGMRKAPLAILGSKEEVIEANLEFKADKVAAISLVLWSKGDPVMMEDKDFLPRIADLRKGLDAHYGVAGVDKGKDAASAAKAQRFQWVKDGIAAQLEYSMSKSERSNTPRGEFIRLRVMPVQKLALGEKEKAAVANVSKASLVTNVQKDENGDVFVAKLPMVDQGEKGYCAVATTERVFRYYGIPCDQHDMAKAAGTSAGGGTSSKELEEVLNKLQNRFKVHVRTLQSLDYKEYVRYMGEYNRLAKKANIKTVDVTSIFVSPSSLDPALLRKARTNGPALGRFQRDVKAYVDKGIPLLWSLSLGMYPENGEKARQDGGGHMRLIIGYNEKTKQFIFSDSWGPGHEKKYIDQSDAIAATTGLYIVEPSAGIK
jgi:hypothetical protein